MRQIDVIHGSIRQTGMRLRHIFLLVFHNYLRVGYGVSRYPFVMSKHREQSLRNRSDILRKCYPLVATGSWDAIAISDIEKVIKQTRGAIAYYFKNKKTLFANILDELFFPVFALSDDEREKLSKATVSDFYNKYKTPFERVRDDLRDNYGVENPSQAIFNLFYPKLQALRPIHIKYRRIDAIGTRIYEPHCRRQSKQYSRPKPRLCREYWEYLH